MNTAGYVLMFSGRDRKSGHARGNPRRSRIPRTHTTRWRTVPRAGNARRRSKTKKAAELLAKETEASGRRRHSGEHHAKPSDEVGQPASQVLRPSRVRWARRPPPQRPVGGRWAPRHGPLATTAAMERGQELFSARQHLHHASHERVHDVVFCANGCRHQDTWPWPLGVDARRLAVSSSALRA